MAVIKKFDLSEVDYESVISKKFDSGNYEDCIKTIRFVLEESEIEIDIVVAGIYLIKSYYNLGLYEEAFYEIKLLVALGANNPELSVLAMETIDKLGRLTTHKYFNYTNFDFINDNCIDEEDQEDSQFTVANSSEEDLLYRKQAISAAIIESIEGRNSIRDEKGFLSVVQKDDSDERLYAKFFGFLSAEKFNDAILLMSAAVAKSPDDDKYIEHLLLAYNCSGQYTKSKETATLLMLLNPNSAMAFYSYLDACNNGAGEVDWKFARAFINNFHAAREYDFFVLLQSIIKYCNNFELAQTVIDNNQHMASSMYCLFVRAYMAYAKQDTQGAINIFKRMRAMFGYRSFADEYIELVKSGKLTIDQACQMPKESSIRATVNIDLLLRDDTINFAKTIEKNQHIFADIKILFYADEIEIAKSILAKFTKDTVIAYMWQLQDLLLDDQRVSAAMKQLILYTMLNKLPKTLFFLGNNDIIEDIDTQDYLPLAEGDKCIEKAIVLAMSKLYFKDTAMSVRLKSSVLHIKKFKEHSLLSNYKYLAELILVDCWYYGLEFTAEEIAAESSLKSSILNNYLLSYDRFSGKFRMQSSDDDIDESITVQGDIDEILGDFASFIEKITADSIDKKPNLKVIKLKNIKLDDENEQND